ncbi:hypothetical protein ACLOJK_036523 [Asimina triloba]
MGKKAGFNGKKKATYEEKGKRKMDETPPSTPPSSRLRRNSGIHINEGRFSSP